MGMGDWGLGIGDWAQSPIPNPQSPIPNPQSPFEFVYLNNEFKNYIYIDIHILNIFNNEFIFYLNHLIFILFN